MVRFQIEQVADCIFDSACLIELQAGATGIQSQLGFIIGTRLIELWAGTDKNKVLVEEMVIVESRALVIGWA